MSSIALLALVTFLYAGYNLFIKVAGGYVPTSATTTVLATFCLQLGAIVTTAIFLSVLVGRGGHVFSLSTHSYVWAVIAGLCIGGAEIAYFYLFSGTGLSEPMPASVAIPVIVSGTIVISLLFSLFFLKEPIAMNQLFGVILILSGIVLLFVNFNPNA